MNKMDRYVVKGHAIYDTKTTDGEIVDTKYVNDSKAILTPCFWFSGYNFPEFATAIINRLNEQDKNTAFDQK